MDIGIHIHIRVHAGHDQKVLELSGILDLVNLNPEISPRSIPSHSI